MVQEYEVWIAMIKRLIGKQALQFDFAGDSAGKTAAEKRTHVIACHQVEPDPASVSVTGGRAGNG